MATNHQILCISKNNLSGVTERITHIGGKNADGKRWKITLSDAIEGIESGKWNFFVNVNGTTVWVIVATSANGNKYLKTQNDGEEANNLLSLPTCP